MERLNSFIALLADGEENKAEIIKYLSLKGIDRYMLVYDMLKKKDLSITWKNLTTVYIYDKRLTYLLQRYMTFFEEYVRANICNRFQIDEIKESNIREMFISKGIVINNKIINSILSILENDNKSLFQILEDSTLFLPMNLLCGIEDKVIDQFINRFSYIKQNVGAVIELRNAVAHNRFLLGYEFGKYKINGKTCNSINAYITAFKEFLPLTILNGEGKHKGFIKEYESLHIGLDNSFLIDNVKIFQIN
jgi:hypothetical protein